MEMTSITAAFTSVKALFDLVKTANNLANQNSFVAAVHDVSEKLIAVTAIAISGQEAQATLTARVQELEQKIRELEQWRADEDKYELLEISTGIFAYLAREAVRPLKSAQKFCAKCFNNKIKMPLQHQDVPEGRNRSLLCAECKTRLIFHRYLDEM